MIVWKCDLKLMESRVIIVVCLLCDVVFFKVGNLSYVWWNCKMIKLIEVDVGVILIRKKIIYLFELMMNLC